MALIKSIFTGLLVFLLIVNTSCTQQLQLKAHKVNSFNKGEFIKEFVLIGPFPNPLPEGETKYFHLEHSCLGFSRDYLEKIGGESSADLKVGKSVTVDGIKYNWQLYKSKEDIIDLKKIFTPNDGVVAYAVLIINSDKEQEKIFGVGSNDGMKAWLNGKMLLKVHKPRTVNIDDEYLKLHLKKGNNILLLKIEQGFGGWGFALRQVDNKDAWKHVNKKLDLAMNSEFHIVDNKITGTVGDNNIVGQLSDLPVAEIEFTAIDGSHTKTIKAQVGSKLELDRNNFPADEYKLSLTFESLNGKHTSYAYMNTKGDVVEELRELLKQPEPKGDNSQLANYYRDYIKTVKWLDSANKLWEHPYGYRRYMVGLQKAYQGLTKLEKSGNQAKRIFPQPKTVNTIAETCKISANWKIHYSKHDDYIGEIISEKWNKIFGSEPEYLSANGSKSAINLIVDIKSGITKEGYLISINKEQVYIKASTQRGLFYGVSSFLQMLRLSNELPVGKIADKPVFPIRSVVLTKTKAEISGEFKEYIKQLADLRYNEIYLPSDNYLHLEDSAKLQNIKDVFAYCKAHYIEPVPYIESFGSHTLTRIIDPCLDEGIYHEKETFKSDKKGIIDLKVKRVHDCEHSTVHIFDVNEKELIKDIDFRIISANENPKVELINKEYFNNDLNLSFDEVDFSGFPHPASCPSNPKGWEIMERVISSIINILHPDKIHISQDEVGFVNKCSLCKARNISNKDLMTDQINHVHRIIRKYDNDIDIYIWGDMFNDFQNAPKIGATGNIEGLPKDIMVHDWNYLGVYHNDKVQTEKQLDHYLNRGYKTGGVAWFEPANAFDILNIGKQYPKQFLGIMHSAWSGFEYSLMPVAEANWTGEMILGDVTF